VASAAHTCTIYVTVLVAVHRYIYVCCSHKAKRLSNLRHAKVHVAIVLVFALCFSLPRVFEYRIQYTPSNSTSGSNLTTHDDASGIGRTVLTDIGDTFQFQIVYKMVCFLLVMYIVPLSTLVFVTVRLLATMRTRRCAAAAVDKRPTAVHGRQQARDDSVTVVLVIIIVVFIVCQTPTLFQRLLLAVNRNEALHCGPYDYVEKLADFLAIFNSCVNFGIYVVFAPHFRRILLVDVMGLRRSRRSRHRRGETGADRCAARASARAGGGAVMLSCAGMGASSTAAAASSLADERRDVSSELSADRSGTAYCSEMAECFAISSPAQSPDEERQQCHQQQQADDVLVNGVASVNSLPLKPLISSRV